MRCLETSFTSPNPNSEVGPHSLRGSCYRTSLLRDQVDGFNDSPSSGGKPWAWELVGASDLGLVRDLWWYSTDYSTDGGEGWRGALKLRFHSISPRRVRCFRCSSSIASTISSLSAFWKSRLFRSMLMRKRMTLSRRLFGYFPHRGHWSHKSRLRSEARETWRSKKFQPSSTSLKAAPMRTRIVDLAVVLDRAEVESVLEEASAAALLECEVIW